MTFPELQNLHAGRPSVVIGKGPSLDAWLAAGCPQPEGSVRIGINQVSALVPDVLYSVSGDAMMEHYLHLPTQWLRGVPYDRTDGTRVINLPAGTGEWFNAQVELNAAHRPALLQQSRQQIAASRRLFCELSSGNPAVHLAWYLGCDSLILVGIDGGSTRARSLATYPDNPPPPTYDAMKRSLEDEADTLFGTRWRHWQAPASAFVVPASAGPGVPSPAQAGTTNGEKWKYDGIYGPGGLPGYGHSNHGQKALEWLIQRHTSILDVGCGHNEFVYACRDRCINAVGCDFACPGADILAPATTLPFTAHQFDLVTAFDVLEHLPEDEVMPALREMARVAGWYCFSIATAPSRILWQGQNLHPTVRPLDWWLDRIREAGGVSEMGPPGYVYGRWRAAA